MRVPVYLVVLLSLIAVPAITLNADEVTVCSDEAVDIEDGPLLADDPPAVTEDTLSIDDELFISDVQIDIDLSHPWLGDLIINLTSPDGTTNELFSLGAGGVEDLLVNFSDAGSDYGSEEWTCACNVQPAFPLSIFRQESSSGDWTLSVLDHLMEDEGTLNEWCVFVEGCDVEGLTTTCEVDDDAGTVTLSWSAPEEDADRINVYRNGESLGSLETTETGFVDEEVPAGRHVYSIGHESDESECETLSPDCEALVGVLEWCLEADETIPNEGGLVESTVELTVEDLAEDAEISGVEARVDITHPFIEDLTIGLTSPGETRTELQFDEGGSAMDVRLTYSDDGVDFGAVEFTCDCLMQPVGPGTMSDLIPEKSPLGGWILDVEDVTDIEDDDGNLNEWCLILFSGGGDDGGGGDIVFLRGDASNDGAYGQIADPIFLLQAGFVLGAPQPACEEAADFSGDGAISFLGDALYGLQATFVPGSLAIPAPHPECGTAKEILIGCEDTSSCEENLLPDDGDGDGGDGDGTGTGTGTDDGSTDGGTSGGGTPGDR